MTKDFDKPLLVQQILRREPKDSKLLLQRCSPSKRFQKKMGQHFDGPIAFLSVFVPQKFPVSPLLTHETCFCRLSWRTKQSPRRSMALTFKESKSLSCISCTMSLASSSQLGAVRYAITIWTGTYQLQLQAMRQSPFSAIKPLCLNYPIPQKHFLLKGTDARNGQSQEQVIKGCGMVHMPIWCIS